MKIVIFSFSFLFLSYPKSSQVFSVWLSFFKVDFSLSFLKHWRLCAVSIDYVHTIMIIDWTDTPCTREQSISRIPNIIPFSPPLPLPPPPHRDDKGGPTGSDMEHSKWYTGCRKSGRTGNSGCTSLLFFLTLKNIEL